LDSTQPELEKTEPNLVSVAREILETRLATSTNNTYIGWKLEDLEKLNSFCQEPILTCNGLNGIFGEAIFLDTLKHSDIEVNISSGDEDYCGIDFYFNGFPIDVTTNPRSLDKKFDPERYTTLYLPRYRGQESALKQMEECINGRIYVLRHLKRGSICIQDYVSDLFKVNFDILENLNSQIDSPQNGGPFPRAGSNNERNLDHILQIFASSNLLCFN
jgi:hypothetical protein